MPEKVIISPRQFTILIIMYTIGTTILVIPSGLAADAKQDAWIAAIIGLIINLGVVWLYTKLASRFPGMTLVQYLDKVYGKWLGKMLSLYFIFYSFIGCTTVLYYMGNFINTQVMPNTPIQALNILFFLLIVMGQRLGLETLARAGEILYPWVIILFIVLLLCLLPNIEIRKLQPIMEADVMSLLKAALSVAGTASLPLISMLMVFPAHVDNYQKAKHGFFAGSAIGGAFFVITTFLCISVLGQDVTARHIYPTYSLAKKINIGDFLTRIEIVVAAIWFITVFFKTSFYFYGYLTGLAQVLKLKDYRPLILPSGLIFVVYSLVVYPNIVYASKFDTTAWIPYILSIGFVLPVLTLCIDILKGKIEKKLLLGTGGGQK